ncbi:hypothetical protein JCM11251_002312 [Rhodosporidiobolus azoricus]
MASFVAKKVGRSALGNHIADYEPADPHYETYQDQRGKQRKRKRAMPQGLSKRDERVLRSVRRRAHYLDKGFSICGFRFGWTFVLGLIPGAGDIAQFLLGYLLVLKKCKEAELPASLVQRMTFNQTVGLGIGLVPLVGDICLAVWKANSRNAALLEDFLIRRAAQQAQSTSSSSSAAASTVPGAAPGPSTSRPVATNRTAIDEEALAELAMGEGGGRIDRKTGEKVGGARAQTGGSGAGNGSGSGSVASETDALVGEGGAGKGKAWYGWGRG